MCACPSMAASYCCDCTRDCCCLAEGRRCGSLSCCHDIVIVTWMVHCYHHAVITPLSYVMLSKSHPSVANCLISPVQHGAWGQRTQRLVALSKSNIVMLLAWHLDPVPLCGKLQPCTHVCSTTCIRWGHIQVPANLQQRSSWLCWPRMPVYGTLAAWCYACHSGIRSHQTHVLARLGPICVFAGSSQVERCPLQTAARHIIPSTDACRENESAWLQGLPRLLFDLCKQQPETSQLALELVHAASTLAAPDDPLAAALEGLQPQLLLSMCFVMPKS